MTFSLLQYRDSNPDRKEHYENIFVCLYELLNFLVCLRRQMLSLSISDYAYTTALTVPWSVCRHWKIHVVLLIFRIDIVLSKPPCTLLNIVQVKFKSKRAVQDHYH